MRISLCLTLAISLTLASKCPKSKKPHIVFCLIDDLGWNDVSFHGSLQIPTPNIDTLAANGVVLNDYYVQPLCTPSRASLMTGRYPIHYGLHSNVLFPTWPAGLNLNLTIFPQHMKSIGYRTHAIGKWHLGFYQREYTPLFRGFESFFGYWSGKMDYYSHIEEGTYDGLGKVWGRVLRRNMDYADEYNGTYSTTLFTKEAVRIINDHNCSEPLFLYFAHQAVHSANEYQLYQAPKKYINRFKYIEDMPRRVFAAMAAALDESIGKLFKALKKKQMLDNTIFVISTDNGGEADGYRGGVGSNWPLRGNKGTTWQGGVRGTALIWSRLIKKSPRISYQLMSIHDWLPSLYYAAGGNPEDLGDIDGINVWDALLNDTPSPRSELLHNIDPMENVQTMRRGNYKLVIENYLENKYSGWYGPIGRDNGISTKTYLKMQKKCDVAKVLKKCGNFREPSSEWLSELNITCNPRNASNVGCNSPESPCLFDVIEDPCEERNIADENRPIVEELLALLQKYNATAVPLVNQTNDPRSNPLRFDYHWTNWADFI